MRRDLRRGVKGELPRQVRAVLVRTVVRAGTVLMPTPMMMAGGLRMLVAVFATRLRRVLRRRDARFVVHAAVAQHTDHQLHSGVGDGEQQQKANQTAQHNDG